MDLEAIYEYTVTFEKLFSSRVFLEIGFSQNNILYCSALSWVQHQSLFYFTVFSAVEYLWSHCITIGFNHYIFPSIYFDIRFVGTFNSNSIINLDLMPGSGLWKPMNVFQVLGYSNVFQQCISKQTVQFHFYFYFLKTKRFYQIDSIVDLWRLE